jgi:hypothetical protein
MCGHVDISNDAIAPTYLQDTQLCHLYQIGDFIVKNISAYEKIFRVFS